MTLVIKLFRIRKNICYHSSAELIARAGHRLVVDNDPKHTTKSNLPVSEWMKANNINHSAVANSAGISHMAGANPAN